jgi:hypothetical protein
VPAVPSCRRAERKPHVWRVILAGRACGPRPKPGSLDHRAGQSNRAGAPRFGAGSSSRGMPATTCRGSSWRSLASLEPRPGQRARSTERPWGCHDPARAGAGVPRSSFHVLAVAARSRAPSLCFGRGRPRLVTRLPRASHSESFEDVDELVTSPKCPLVRPTFARAGRVMERRSQEPPTMPATT